MYIYKDYNHEDFMLTFEFLPIFLNLNQLVDLIGLCDI